MDLRLAQPTFIVDEPIPCNKSATVEPLFEPWLPMIESKIPTMEDPKSKHNVGSVFSWQARSDSGIGGTGRAVHLSRIFLGGHQTCTVPLHSTITQARWLLMARRHTQRDWSNLQQAVKSGWNVDPHGLPCYFSRNTSLCLLISLHSKFANKTLLTTMESKE